MGSVVLLRNVNQGQRGHPATADILAAFADAGIPDARTFQSNGTVVIPGEIDPEALADVSAALAARSGHERDARAIALDELIAVARAYGDDADAREFTLHAGPRIDIDAPDVRGQAERWGCRLVASGEGWVVAAHLLPQGVSATPLLEQLTGEPATSRGMRTIVRLADRFAE